MADSTTDVGVGYRLMEKDEPVLEGDEMDVTGTWEKSSNYIVGKQGRGIRYRRPVSAAAPAASTPPAPHASPDVDRWRTRANGVIIQEGDDIRKVVGGTVVVDWEPASALVGHVVGYLGWQARYRITEPVVEQGGEYRNLFPGEIIAEGDQYKASRTGEWRTTKLVGAVIREDDGCPYRRHLTPSAPEPEMTIGRWFTMSVAERREYNRPAVMAWLGGQSIQQMTTRDAWHDRTDLHTQCPLRVKPEILKLVWELGTDSRRNDLWQSKPGRYTIIQVLRNNVVHWKTNLDNYGYSSPVNAKAACQRHYEKEAA